MKRWGRNTASGGVSVVCTVVFQAIGTSGRGGNKTIENGPKIAFLGTRGVGATVLGLEMGAGVERTNSGGLASLFEIAKLDAIAV